MASVNRASDVGYDYMIREEKEVRYRIILRDSDNYLKFCGSFICQTSNRCVNPRTITIFNLHETTLNDNFQRNRFKKSNFSVSVTKRNLQSVA